MWIHNFFVTFVLQCRFYMHVSHNPVHTGMYVCVSVCLHVCMYGSTSPDLLGQYHPWSRIYQAEIFTGPLPWPNQKKNFFWLIKGLSSRWWCGLLTSFLSKQHTLNSQKKQTFWAFNFLFQKKVSVSLKTKNYSFLSQFYDLNLT